MELRCVYGSEHSPDVVCVYDDWYAVDGASIVNLASDKTDWQHGIDVEMVEDVDCFTWSDPIHSLQELIKAVES